VYNCPCSASRRVNAWCRLQFPTAAQHWHLHQHRLSSSSALPDHQLPSHSLDACCQYRVGSCRYRRLDFDDRQLVYHLGHRRDHLSHRGVPGKFHWVVGYYSWAGWKELECLILVAQLLASLAHLVLAVIARFAQRTVRC
jgi:hypothetical protein